MAVDGEFTATTPEEYSATLRRMLHEAVPRSINKSAVVRPGTVAVLGTESKKQTRITLDTGADSGSYIGQEAITALGPNCVVEPCRHRVRLGDGQTMLSVTKMVYVDIQLEDNYGELTDPITTAFYIVPTLGYDVIVGLPDILGNYFDHFSAFMHEARQSRLRHGIVSNLENICNKITEELSRAEPRSNRLSRFCTAAKQEASSYLSLKRRVCADPSALVVLTSAVDGDTVEVIKSEKYGTVYADLRVENILAAIEDTTNLEFTDYPPGSILEPWAEEPIVCPEEESTPDPLAFGEDVLRFMELSVEESRQEYLDLLPKHVSEGMAKACPQVFDLLKSYMAQEIFAPSSWPGMKVPPAVMDILSPLPSRMTPAARPVRPALFAAARKEFERLRQYFYVDSRSSIASPLVIAPKATAPFIRFCGDYREVNKYVSIPQQPIPIVQHELVKAAKYKVYVDLDMANSFHQIPLSEEFSNLLSVQTPWGLFRPLFLPEGVGPASGLLQHLVREIFQPFEEWTIVIFDNFLILADDYNDAYTKLDQVLQRCQEYGVILKLKKSFIGVDKVSFFGYEVRHGQWCMSASRKDAISAMPFPKTAKEMQSFLGAALFFHHHVPDYSEWSARLYEMTHATFVWDPGQWTYDYVGHFDRFKEALQQSATLHFPDYSLPWVLRVDASQYAVGAVLFQEVTDGDTVIHQPIAFSSKRFSEPATKWDAYKRECYAIFHGVHTFAYYLRGKHFLVETDHRNLQWIEASPSPIVTRWRTLLQSFHFSIRHIAGKLNGVADYLSRMGFFTSSTPPATDASTVFHMEGAETSTDHSTIDNLFLEQSTLIDVPAPTLHDLLSSVHGKHRLHYGAYQTWYRAKLAYPQANISITAVREWVKNCGVCQKFRDVGIRSLPEQTLTLKKGSYRKTIGIDHLAVKEDKNGNKVVIMIVEHYSHFPQIYPAKDYTAEEVARVLFKHITTHGVFEELASDPGSSFCSDVVKQLNEWLGIRHKISLVDRHESNGCEGSNKQFLRHLRALLADTKLYDQWSSDEVMCIINFEMCSFPTAETGGFTPFELKYGREDAKWFKLPDKLEPGVQAAELLKRLETNIQAARTVSTKLQEEIAQERAAADGSIPHLEPGDLVLWNSRSSPCQPLTDKTLGEFMGPYRVIKQVKNDVTVRHLAIGQEKVVHISRVRPYFGDEDQALELAKLDYNQMTIKSINYWSGNIYHRHSLLFNVTFEDSETVDLRFTRDLSDSVNFEEFVSTQPMLQPLLGTAVKMKKDQLAARKLVITMYQPRDKLYVDLRYYDQESSMWFDSLGLPPSSARYMTEGEVIKLNNSGKKIYVSIGIYNSTIALDWWDIQLYCSDQLDGNFNVTKDWFTTYPRLKQND